MSQAVPQSGTFGQFGGPNAGSQSGSLGQNLPSGREKNPDGLIPLAEIWINNPDMVNGRRIATHGRGPDARIGLEVVSGCHNL